jgi:hypothetical protein
VGNGSEPPSHNPLIFKKKGRGLRLGPESREETPKKCVTISITSKDITDVALHNMIANPRLGKHEFKIPNNTKCL